MSSRLRTFEGRTTATAGGLAAALMLSTLVTGCVGDEGGADGREGDHPAPATVGFRKLERRRLDLPTVDLGGRSIREYGVAGRCFREVEVGAIALPAIPGEAALGPWPGEAELKRGPLYAALLAGPPRIVFLSATPTIGDSRWRAVRTIWVSRPTYDGPVLVRGGRLDRPGRLGFGSRAHPRWELRLPAGAWPLGDIHARGRGQRLGEGWRVSSVPTRIRAPGCYAFQVDGLDFSYVLAFGVQRS
jgi:hypothetical protein